MASLHARLLDILLPVPGIVTVPVVVAVAVPMRMPLTVAVGVVMSACY